MNEMLITNWRQGEQFVQELWGHEDRVFSLTVIIVIFITGYNNMIL